ncbi:MAG: hypothetical protein OIF48_10095 [Silicimonas sp.]|nr:hypothetical protein [Silicimonas sp.]
MKSTIATAGLALASLFIGQAALAATVTATFEGTLNNATGDFASSFGETAVLTLVGEDDAAPGTDLASWITASSYTAAASYALTSVSIDVPATGVSESVAPSRFYVYDNATDGTDTFDILAVGIPGGTSDGFRYVAAFLPDTFSGATLSVAIGEGLANTQTQQQSFIYGTTVPNGSANRSTLGAEIGITSLIVGSTGGGTGGGGNDGSNGGGDTGGGNGGTDPMPSPIPLPAGAPLLLAGLGMLGWMRKRR